MQDTENRVFEFGDFILAPEERLLLCGGEPTPLTAKAFDLLVTLVRRSGHLVSKDDLLPAVLPDTIVEEVNLTVNISALRKALAGDAARPVYSLANVDNWCWPWIEAVLSD